MRLYLSLGNPDRAAALYQNLQGLTAALELKPQAATREPAAQASRLARAQVAPAPGPRRSPLHTPLIGRESTWPQPSRREAPLCVLSGEPEVGQTRLAPAVAGEHAAGLLLRGREETRHTLFHPIAQLIQGALTARCWSAATLDEV